MRLINADKLLHQGYDYVVDGIAYDSCNKSMDIEDIPTVQAIPLSKVKQAKLEVEDIRELTKYGWKSPRELKEEFIEILDNLIAESEN